MEGDLKGEKEKLCDWCGEFPVYIGIWKDRSYTIEEFLCKKCFSEIDSSVQMP